MTSTRSVTYRPLAVLSARYAPLWPLVRATLAVVGIAYVVAAITGVIEYSVLGPAVAWAGESGDVAAYYAADAAHPYSGGIGDPLAYLYSPAFVQVIAPLQNLPWEVFRALWLVAQLAALWWLRALWLIPVPFVYDDLIRGNIHTFYAVAVVVGFRHAGAWALPLLTKVTPGVGLVWFAVRREWRMLAVALGVTASIAAVSALINPQAWLDWIDLLRADSETVAAWNMLPFPVAYRLPLAAAVVAFGAWKRWRWVVPVGMLLAMPSAWQSSGALLAAIPRLTRHRPSTDRTPRTRWSPVTPTGRKGDRWPETEPTHSLPR